MPNTMNPEGQDSAPAKGPEDTIHAGAPKDHETGTPARDGHGGSLRLWTDVRLWGIVALAVGLGIVLSSRFVHEVTPRLKADDVHYHDLARTFLHSGRLESTYRAPGYPVFVALVYAVFGPRPFAVYITQSVLFALSVPLVAAIFWHICRSRAAALTAGLMTACYPLFYLQMLTVAYPEAFALFLVGLFVLALQAAISQPLWWRSAAAGVAFAALALTKAVVLPFAGVAAVCMVLMTKDRSAGIRQAAIFLALAIACIAPWTYRNWKLTGALVPVSTGAGVNFWMGNYARNYHERLQAPDRQQGWPNLPADLAAATQGMTEVQRDSYLKRVAWGYIRENPGRAASIFLQKFSNLWLGSLGTDRKRYEPGEKPLWALGDFSITRTSLLNCPIFILGLVGFWLLRSEQRRAAVPVALLLVWFTFVYVVVVGEGRYGQPVMPLLLGFAAVALVRTASALCARLSS